jgi:hypothetical protein
MLLSNIPRIHAELSNLHVDQLPIAMSEYSEEMERRHRAEMEARGRTGAMFIIFFFLVAIPAWVFVAWYFLGLFRTTPLKGTKHPNKTANTTNGTDVARVEVRPRWWVYQHPPTNTSRIGPEEEAYRKKREKEAEDYALAQERYVINFERWYGSVGDVSEGLMGRMFSENFLTGVFEGRMPFGKQFKISQEYTQPSVPVLSKCRNIIEACLTNPTACDSHIYGHLHYGDNPEIYYEARNAFFVFKGASFVRVFVIDVIRLPTQFGDNPVNPQPLVALMESEHPSTDEAWLVDPEYPESEDAMGVDDTVFKDSKIKYDAPFNAILNYLNVAMDGVLGLRFSEVLGIMSPAIEEMESSKVELVHSDTSIMTLKERKRKEQRSATTSEVMTGDVGVERKNKDEF